MVPKETGSILEWIRIQEEDFSVEEETNRIKERSKRIGGIVTFLGTARDFSKARTSTESILSIIPAWRKRN